ncbi:MAG: hypothetical protein ACOXZ9_02560 [Bacteroidales bacterium]|jgi:hypothetical protein
MAEYRGYLIPRHKLPFWDLIIVDNDFVTHRRYKMIGVDEKRIPLKAINGVELKRGVLFCSIIINSMGETIVAEGFTNADGKEIRRLLGF